MREAVIVSTARTPIGKAYRGAFNDTQAQELAGHAIRHAVERAGVAPGEIEDVVIGCALQQGSTGSNIGRQAAMRAGLPTSVAGMSIDRQCASGMMAIATAAKQVIHDGMQIAVGGGVESISLVQNQKMRTDRLRDPWLMEHLPALYMTMIETAETVAERYKVSREAQDEYALQSQQRTATAQQAGRFQDEIAPLPSVMKVQDKADGRDLGQTSHARARRGQPPDDDAGGAAGARPGLQGRDDDQGRPLHHRRQRLAALGRRLGLGRHGGARGRAPGAHSRSATTAAWPWPAATPTRWGSARSSPCRSCSRRTG